MSDLRVNNNVTFFFLAQKKKASITMMDDDQDDGLPGELLLPAKSFSFERDLLRILAEIRFINAEVINLHRCYSYLFHLALVVCLILGIFILQQ